MLKLKVCINNYVCVVLQ